MIKQNYSNSFYIVFYKYMASNCSRVTKKVINLKKDQTFTLLEHINLYLNMSALNIIETHFKIRQTDYAVISMGEKKASQSSIPLAGSLLGFPLLLFLPFFSQQRKSVHKVTTISQHKIKIYKLSSDELYLSHTQLYRV